jgi:outer membrane protein assembly factor BamB
MWILTKNPGLGYSSIRYISTKRDSQFEELGNKYYGQIDTDIVKEIMSDPIISKSITDVKLTDSKLLEQNGLWAFFGNTGKVLNYTNIDTTTHKTESVYPNGWVRVFGVPSKGDFSLTNQDNYFGKETEIQWNFDTEFNKNEFKSSGVIKDDTLFSVTSDGMIYALDIENGQLQWKKPIGENPTKPILYKDLIFVGHTEGISIVDKHGSIKRISSTNEIISSPAIANNMIIFGDNIGNVYSYSIDDKKEKWNIELSDEIYIAQDHNENIYLTSGNNCYAVRLKDQKILWQFNSSGMITSAPVLKDGKIFFGSWDNYVYALNAKNGALIWKYETGWGIDTSPVISKGLVYIGCNDNNLYALNQKNGTFEWMFSCKAGIHSSPFVYGDFLFFGSDDGRLYAVNKTNGDGEWFFAANLTIDDNLLNYITTPILSNPVVYNGTAFIGANGIIYALDAQTFEKVNLNDDESRNDMVSEPWVFIILSLLVIIIATTLYLIFSKKRFK